MNFIEQLLATAVLVDILFGIMIGIVLSASWASRREDHCRSLLSVAPDPVCAGVRVLIGLYTADDGYLQYLLSWEGMARWRPGLPESYGKEAGR
jgi:predicted transporter